MSKRLNKFREPSLDQIDDRHLEFMRLARMERDIEEYEHEQRDAVLTSEQLDRIANEYERRRNI